jgi:hypothetical protein
MALDHIGWPRETRAGTDPREQLTGRRTTGHFTSIVSSRARWPTERPEQLGATLPRHRRASPGLTSDRLALATLVLMQVRV